MTKNVSSESQASATSPPQLPNNTVGPEVYRGNQCARLAPRVCVTSAHLPTAASHCLHSPAVFLQRCIDVCMPSAHTSLSPCGHSRRLRSRTTFAVRNDEYIQWVRHTVKPIKYDREPVGPVHNGTRAAPQQPEVFLMTHGSFNKCVKSKRAFALPAHMPCLRSRRATTSFARRVNGAAPVGLFSDTQGTEGVCYTVNECVLSTHQLLLLQNIFIPGPLRHMRMRTPVMSAHRNARPGFHITSHALCRR